MKIDITNENGILSRKIRLRSHPFRVLFFSCILLFTNSTMANSNPRMTITELQNLPANKVVLIDARPAWKYLLGHIPRAIHLSDWKEFTLTANGVRGLVNHDKSFIAEKLSALGIDHSKTIVIYGDSRDKWRSDGRFFWMFEYFGFKQVGLLEGGIEAWKRAKLSLKVGREKPESVSSISASEINFNQDIIAKREWILERLNSDSIAIVDNRETSEFKGATPYGSSRGGHIPGAIHIKWYDFFTEDGLMKPEEELNAILKDHGIKENQEIVVYCTGGVRSAMAYYVFKILGYKVRNYDGSWWEWSHSLTSPVEQ